MARAIILVAIAAVVAASGCGGSDDERPVVEEETTTPTTTTRAADGDRRPPVGDGRGGVRLERIGEFAQPLYVTQPPGGDPRHLFVVERCGRVARVPLSGGEAETFLDLSDLITCEGIEQGLLSVAFAPDYRRSGLLYVYYTDAGGDQTVVEYRRSERDPGVADRDSARELLRMEDFASNHNGGLVLFGPDDMLWIGTGDGGGAGDPERNGQDLSALLGKILRIDPRPAARRPYRIPRDNPHLDDPGARAEIAVSGLRNPWRFSFDPETADLWIGDVGQNELEEIDVAEFERVVGRQSELNFGWSAFEGTQRFNEDQEAPGAVPPVHEYGREGGCSVTGGHVVRDPALASLYGRYLYGDYCQGELRSFIARPGADAPDDRQLGLRVPSLSSFGIDAAGRLYATSLEGPVYRLAPGG